jgi:hypothetical protein
MDDKKKYAEAFAAMDDKKKYAEAFAAMDDKKKYAEAFAPMDSPAIKVSGFSGLQVGAYGDEKIIGFMYNNESNTSCKSPFSSIISLFPATVMLENMSNTAFSKSFGEKYLGNIYLCSSR